MVRRAACHFCLNSEYHMKATGEQSVNARSSPFFVFLKIRNAPKMIGEGRSI